MMRLLRRWKMAGRYKDITGQVFGKCEAIKYLRSDKRHAVWEWRCLGNGPGCMGTFESPSYVVRRGSKLSCGCHKRADVSNQIFHGSCEALQFARSDSGKTIWLFKCLHDGPDCKRNFEAMLSGVRSGNIKSCGCLGKENRINSQTTHAKSSTLEYASWQSMLDRCYNPNNPQYGDYGGRGIKVCDRWLGENGFINFYQDKGPKPNPDDTLERYDNDLGYSPDNCGWEDRITQARNRRDNVIKDLEEAELIRDLHKSGYSIEILALCEGCAYSTMYSLINRRTWI